MIKTWILAFVLTCIVTLAVFGTCKGVDYIFGVPCDKLNFVMVLGLIAIYMQFSHLIDDHWKKD